MYNLYKYLLIILIISPLFNQEVGENDVVLSKDDLYEIAESLIDIGDINNAKNVCFRKINSPFVNYKYTTFI